MTPLGWPGIVRLGLVQSALGAIVALTTSTLNRVMVVEYALPAMIPAGLVAWHYAIQLSRPRWGYGSDIGHRRTPWIIGGMGVLALGGLLAAVATVLMGSARTPAMLLAVLAFTMIGVGVGASGTSLLALLAARVAPARRPAAASMTWILMIVGIIVSAATVGQLIEPFSPARLVSVAGGVAAAAFALTVFAVWGIEGAAAAPAEAVPAAASPPFATVIREVWDDPRARRFTIFVFVSMLAYSAQDLILEPFAGLLFGYTPGQSTSLASVQHGGVLLGMILVGVAGNSFGKGQGWMRGWTLGGCIGSALALAGLVAAAHIGPGWPLKPTVFALGFANGVFAVAAIGSMMALAGAGGEAREGVRIGLWGAAQAVAFGLGGFLGAAGVDFGRRVFATTGEAFIAVFAVEALLFLLAAWLAARIDGKAAAADYPPPLAAKGSA